MTRSEKLLKVAVHKTRRDGIFYCGLFTPMEILILVQYGAKPKNIQQEFVIQHAQENRKRAQGGQRLFRFIATENLESILEDKFYA